MEHTPFWPPSSRHPSSVHLKRLPFANQITCDVTPKLCAVLLCPFPPPHEAAMTLPTMLQIYFGRDIGWSARMGAVSQQQASSNEWFLRSFASSSLIFARICFSCPSLPLGGYFSQYSEGEANNTSSPHCCPLTSFLFLRQGLVQRPPPANRSSDCFYCMRPRFPMPIIYSSCSNSARTTAFLSHSTATHLRFLWTCLDTVLLAWVGIGYCESLSTRSRAGCND